MELNTKKLAVDMVSLVAAWADVNPELFAELVAAHKHHSDVCWNLGSSAQVESIANKYRLCRKIEEQMNQAVANNKSWTNANTSVTYCEENGESRVYLHGNHIATVGDDFLQVFDGGWQSNTTKSRLNALINRFCNAVTDGVYQRQHVWYLMDNKVEREFESGYIFA